MTGVQTCALPFSDGKLGTSGSLKAKLDHDTCPPDGLNKFFQRFNRYTTQAAERYHREGRKPAVWKMFFHPAWEFFKMYILKRGFLDGTEGLIIAMMGSYYTFLKYGKLYEKQRSSIGTPR